MVYQIPTPLRGWLNSSSWLASIFGFTKRLHLIPPDGHLRAPQLVYESYLPRRIFRPCSRSRCDFGPVCSPMEDAAQVTKDVRLDRARIQA